MRILSSPPRLPSRVLGSAAAAAEDVRPSQLACDATKDRRARSRRMPALRRRSRRQGARCEPSKRRSSRSRRARALLSSQKARWRRSLTEAQAQWVNWRDAECQDVAPFEAGMTAKGGDPQTQLHHRLRRPARREPQGALSLSGRSPAGALRRCSTVSASPPIRSTASPTGARTPSEVARCARAATRARSSSRATCRCCSRPKRRLEPLLPLAEIERARRGAGRGAARRPVRRRAGVRRPLAATRRSRSNPTRATAFSTGGCSSSPAATI